MGLFSKKKQVVAEAESPLPPAAPPVLRARIPESLPFRAAFGSVDRHYRQADYGEVLSLRADSWQATAWKGDTLNAMLVLTAKDEPVRGLCLRASDFSDGESVIPAAAIQPFWPGETKAYIGRGGKWDDSALKESVPDILFAAPPEELEKQRVQPVWLRIQIPKESAPGVYQGSLSLSCAGCLEQAVLVFSFEVLDLQQPEASVFEGHSFGLELWQYPYTVARYYGIPEAELFGGRHLAILEEQLKLYKTAGGNAITVTVVEDPWNSQTYDPYPSMVKWIKTPDGSFSFDYSHFDAYVSLALRMGIDGQLKSFSMIPWGDKIRYYDAQKGRAVTVAYKPGTQKWAQLWDAFLESYVAHLEEKGWFGMAYIALDERPAKQLQPVIDLLGRHPDSGGQCLKLSCAMNYSSTDEAQRALMDKIDDISVNIDHADAEGKLRAFARERRKRGQTTTLYTCTGHYPNSFVRSDPAESAWTAWYALSQNLDGFLRWAYDAWAEDPLTDTSFRSWESGDPFFVYPGGKAEALPLPRSSPRFERLREGIRDVEKARWLLGCGGETAKQLRALLASLGRAEGKVNAYGAKEAGSQENRDFITAEVNRMRAGMETIAREFLAAGGNEESFQLNRLVPEPEKNVKLLPLLCGLSVALRALGGGIKAVLKKYKMRRDGLQTLKHGWKVKIVQGKKSYEHKSTRYP